MKPRQGNELWEHLEEQEKRWKRAQRRKLLGRIAYYRKYYREHRQEIRRRAHLYHLAHKKPPEPYYPEKLKTPYKPLTEKPVK